MSVYKTVGLLCDKYIICINISGKYDAFQIASKTIQN